MGALSPPMALIQLKDINIHLLKDMDHIDMHPVGEQEAAAAFPKIHNAPAQCIASGREAQENAIMHGDQTGPTGRYGKSTLSVTRIMRTLPSPRQAMQEYRMDLVEKLR